MATLSGPYTLGGGEAAGMAQYNPSAPPTKNPQVLEELEILERIVNELAGAIRVLDERLVKVSLQEVPTKQKDAKVMPQLVPVATHIRSQRESIACILSHVNSILERLEI